MHSDIMILMVIKIVNLVSSKGLIYVIIGNKEPENDEILVIGDRIAVDIIMGKF